MITDSIFENVGGREQFDKVDVQLHRTDKINPNSNEEAQAFLRIDVMSKDADKVGRLFNAKIVELALANFPGWTGRSGVVPSGPFIEYWPALVDSKFVKEQVHFQRETKEVVPTSQLDFEEILYQKEPYSNPEVDKTILEEVPFGNLYGTRSGDKGGCANIGIWAKSENAFSFLNNYLTVKKIKELMPDISEFEIDRYELPNILSLNFYIHDILEDGVSSNNRKDGQAKSLGEYLRAKYADIPKSLFEENL